MSHIGYRQAVYGADVFLGNAAGKSNFYHSNPVFKPPGCAYYLKKVTLNL